jgi:hypothetical protein
MSHDGSWREPCVSTDHDSCGHGPGDCDEKAVGINIQKVHFSGGSGI